MTSYRIRNTRTREVKGWYMTSKAAHRACDKGDMAYGAITWAVVYPSVPSVDAQRQDALPYCDGVRSIISLQTGDGYATEAQARDILAQFSPEVRPMLGVSEFIWAGAFR